MKVEKTPSGISGLFMEGATTLQVDVPDDGGSIVLVRGWQDRYCRRSYWDSEVEVFFKTPEEKRNFHAHKVAVLSGVLTADGLRFGEAEFIKGWVKVHPEIEREDALEEYRRHLRRKIGKEFSLNSLSRMDEKLLQCYGGIPHTVSVTSHFRDLETPLKGYLRQYDAVLGCMAWFTLSSLLGAMQELKRGCAFVVAKTDALESSPGVWGLEDNSLLLRDMPRSFWENWPGLDPEDSFGGARCFGDTELNTDYAAPILHHKFLVFGKVRTVGGAKRIVLRDSRIVPPKPSWAVCDKWWEQLDVEVAARNDLFFAVEEADVKERVVWEAVWKGSRNFTQNGNRSLDSADFIVSKEYADIHAQEFGQLAALSESRRHRGNAVQPDWGHKAWLKERAIEPEVQESRIKRILDDEDFLEFTETTHTKDEKPKPFGKKKQRRGVR